MTWFMNILSLRRFFYLIIAIAILFSATVLWLSQLDFNKYRGPIEEQLSQIFEQPVHIESVSLTFSGGLALAIDQLTIGNSEKPLVTVPEMLAKLNLKPLLKRRIDFNDIRLHQPKINIVLPSTSHKKKTDKALAPFSFPKGLSINRLQISDAEIDISRSENNELTSLAHLTHLQVTISHLRPETVATLVVTGKLKNRNADFLLETNLPPQLDLQDWRYNNFDTTLTVKNLETTGLLQLRKGHFPSQIDLVATIAGPPMRGAQITTSLKSSETSKNLASLHGVWNSEKQREQIDITKTDLLGIPLTGQFSLTRSGEENSLIGQIGVNDLQLNTQLFSQLKITHADELQSGQLKKLSISIDHHWPIEKKLTELPPLTAQLEVKELKWKREEFQYLRDFTTVMTLSKQQLKVNHGRFHIKNIPFNFKGTVLSPFAKAQFSLILSSRLNTEALPIHLGLPNDLHIAGQFPVRLKISGELPSPSLILDSDLTDLNIGYKTFFNKKTGIPSQLHLETTLNNSTIEITNSLLTLDKQKISAQASIQRQDPSHNISLKVASLNLEKLSIFSPLLKKIQVEGNLAGTLKIDPVNWQGELHLDRFGAHLTSILGKLRNTTGTIKLNQSGLAFENLQTGLGESYFTASGKLTDWTAPTLNLDVAGTNIRAQDLIFRNQQLTLYDLDGHLVINGSGIIFSPVNVRLEEGTQAQVTGTVINFKNPEVSLDINGQKVEVLDVINLFIGPPKTSHKKDTTVELKPIVISVHAQKGVIGGFHFENAHGLITDNHKQFILAPLTFENGAGEGSARVVFDRTDNNAPLKVSGHVNKIEASILHQDLFNKPGLISGELDGDFYLEGSPAEGKFWSTTQGGMNIKIKKGVLRKFKTLAKVFSLLNVSQLFKGQLPDMNSNGMPFSLLEGSVAFKGGKAVTNDLKIKSNAMNMSMVGWQAIDKDEMDFTLGIMPLGTIDKVITSIPIAGWVLTGENKAFLTVYFKLQGSGENPSVSAIPAESLSDTVLGTFKRTLGLPGKLIKDIRSLFQNDSAKKAEP